FQRQHELFVSRLLGMQHDTIDKLHPKLAAGVTTARAQFGRTNALEAEETVDAARLPVARVAAVDEHDRMQISRGPNGRRKSRGPAAHDADVVHAFALHALTARQEGCLPHFLTAPGPEAACTTTPASRGPPAGCRSSFRRDTSSFWDRSNVRARSHVPIRAGRCRRARFRE